MDNKFYLSDKIPQYILSTKSTRYLYAYYFTRAKRFFIHTIVIFFFQYLTISSLPITLPALPLYAPMGIAFVLFYLLGNNSFIGLLLGGLCAYLSQGLSLSATTCYLLADIGCGYLGARICRNIFTSDITTSIKIHTWFKFIFANALITCLLSSSFRMLAIHHLHLTTQVWIYNFIDYWLADLNAITAFSAFLFSWISIYLSREKISSKPITKLSIISAMGFIVLAVFFIKKMTLIYLLIITSGIILYLAYTYGYLVATLLLYIFSLIYTAYFMAHEAQYLNLFGIAYYLSVPLFLLAFIVGMLFVGIKRDFIVR